jgi:hypothetical protein
MAAHTFEFHAYLLETPGNPPAVGLKLSLARSTRTDSTAEARHLDATADQARQQITQLGKLDLKLALPSAGAPGEDVQNELGAVDYLDRQRALQVALLSGTKISVEDDDAGLRGPRELCEFLNLATADQGGSFRGGPRLDDVLDHGGSGALRQRRKLFQGLFGRIP